MFILAAKAARIFFLKEAEMSEFVSPFPLVITVIAAIGAFLFAIRRKFGKEVKCVCVITQGCNGRIRSERIDGYIVDFLCDLAEANGFGLKGDRGIQYRGTDIVARFQPTGEEEDGLSVVEMWTIYHDLTRYNSDGTPKEAGKDQRTFRVRSRDHHED